LDFGLFAFANHPVPSVCDAISRSTGSTKDILDKSAAKNSLDQPRSEPIGSVMGKGLGSYQLRV